MEEQSALDRLIELSQVHVKAHQRTENGQTYQVGDYYRNSQGAMQNLMAKQSSPFQDPRSMNPEQLNTAIRTLQQMGVSPNTTPYEHSVNRPQYDRLVAEWHRRQQAQQQTAVQAVAQPNPNALTDRWEYKTVTEGSMLGGPSKRRMDEMAAQGWELANIKPRVESQGWVFKDRRPASYVFKRRMTAGAVAAADAETARRQGTKWGKFRHAVSAEGLDAAVQRQNVQIAQKKAEKAARRQQPF